MFPLRAIPTIVSMNTSPMGGFRRPRRLTGVVITILGLLLLVGVPFVPVGTIISDPGLVPYPERLFAFWLILVGLALAVWPTGTRS